MGKKLWFAVLMAAAVAGMTACKKEGEMYSPALTVYTEEYPQTAGADFQDIKEGNNLQTAYYDNKVPNTITVNSNEKVSVAPDMAQVVYAVRTKESTAVACRQKNAEAVNRVICLLLELGMKEKSIQTSNYSMNPVYNYSGNTAKLTGYEAVATLTVSDISIDSLDNVLEQSVLSGINTVESITYQASKYDSSYQEALQKAVAAAYEKAKVLAEASGAKVGKTVSIREASGYSQVRYTDNTRSAMLNTYSDKEEAMADYAAFMPGEVEAEARIIVEYELN